MKKSGLKSSLFLALLAILTLSFGTHSCSRGISKSEARKIGAKELMGGVLPKDMSRYVVEKVDGNYKVTYSYSVKDENGDELKISNFALVDAKSGEVLEIGADQGDE